MSKGYIKIENDLFEFLYSNDLNVSELKVLIFLIRYTKGFKRDTCRASYSFIAKGTNKNIETVRRAVKELISKKIISIEYEAVGCKAQILKISYTNLITSYPQLRGSLIHNYEDDSIHTFDHQDIKKDIKNKEIKKEESASASFSSNNEVEDDDDDGWWERFCNGEEDDEE